MNKVSFVSLKILKAFLFYSKFIKKIFTTYEKMLFFFAKLPIIFRKILSEIVFNKKINIVLLNCQKFIKFNIFTLLISSLSS